MSKILLNLRIAWFIFLCLCVSVTHSTFFLNPQNYVSTKDFRFGVRLNAKDDNIEGGEYEFPPVRNPVIGTEYILTFVFFQVDPITQLSVPLPSELNSLQLLSIWYISDEVFVAEKNKESADSPLTTSRRYSADLRQTGLSYYANLRSNENFNPRRKTWREPVILKVHFKVSAPIHFLYLPKVYCGAFEYNADATPIVGLINRVEVQKRKLPITQDPTYTYSLIPKNSQKSCKVYIHSQDLNQLVQFGFNQCTYGVREWLCIGPYARNEITVVLTHSSQAVEMISFVVLCYDDNSIETEAMWFYSQPKLNEVLPDKSYWTTQLPQEARRTISFSILKNLKTNPSMNVFIECVGCRFDSEYTIKFSTETVPNSDTSLFSSSMDNIFDSIYFSPKSMTLTPNFVQASASITPEWPCKMTDALPVQIRVFATSQDGFILLYEILLLNIVERIRFQDKLSVAGARLAGAALNPLYHIMLAPPTTGAAGNAFFTGTRSELLLFSVGPASELDILKPKFVLGEKMPGVEVNDMRLSPHSTNGVFFVTATIIINTDQNKLQTRMACSILNSNQANFLQNLNFNHFMDDETSSHVACWILPTFAGMNIGSYSHLLTKSAYLQTDRSMYTSDILGRSLNDVSVIHRVAHLRCMGGAELCSILDDTMRSDNGYVNSHSQMFNRKYTIVYEAMTDASHARYQRIPVLSPMVGMHPGNLEVGDRISFEMNLGSMPMVASTLTDMDLIAEDPFKWTIDTAKHKDYWGEDSQNVLKARMNALLNLPIVNQTFMTPGFRFRFSYPRYVRLVRNNVNSILSDEVGTGQWSNYFQSYCTYTPSTATGKILISEITMEVVDVFNGEIGNWEQIYGSKAFESPPKIHLEANISPGSIGGLTDMEIREMNERPSLSLTITDANNIPLFLATVPINTIFPTKSQWASMIVSWGTYGQHSMRLYNTRSTIARKALHDLEKQGKIPKVPVKQGFYESNLGHLLKQEQVLSVWDDDLTYLRGTRSHCSEDWPLNNHLSQFHKPYVDCPLFSTSSLASRSFIDNLPGYTHTGYELLDSVTIQPIFKYDPQSNPSSNSYFGSRVFMTFGASCHPDAASPSGFSTCQGCKPLTIDSTSKGICECATRVVCSPDTSPRFKYGAEFGQPRSMPLRYASKQTYLALSDSNNPLRFTPSSTENYNQLHLILPEHDFFRYTSEIFPMMCERGLTRPPIVGENTKVVGTKLASDIYPKTIGVFGTLKQEDGISSEQTITGGIGLRMLTSEYRATSVPSVSSSIRMSLLPVRSNNRKAKLKKVVLFSADKDSDNGDDPQLDALRAVKEIPFRALGGGRMLELWSQSDIEFCSQHTSCGACRSHELCEWAIPFAGLSNSGCFVKGIMQPLRTPVEMCDCELATTVASCLNLSPFPATLDNKLLQNLESSASNLNAARVSVYANMLAFSRAKSEYRLEQRRKLKLTGPSKCRVCAALVIFNDKTGIRQLRFNLPLRMSSNLKYTTVIDGSAISHAESVEASNALNAQKIPFDASKIACFEGGQKHSASEHIALPFSSPTRPHHFHLLFAASDTATSPITLSQPESEASETNDPYLRVPQDALTMES